MLQDLRYAIRSYANTPEFTALTIFVLAIGIGANTAMFTGERADVEAALWSSGRAAFAVPSPGGVELGGIVRLETGEPFKIGRAHV